MSFEKRDLPATFIVFTMEGILHVPVTKVQPHLSILVIFSIALFQEFHFLLVSSQGYLSNKISFISIGVSLQKLSKFLTGEVISGKTRKLGITVYETIKNRSRHTKGTY